MKRVSDSDFRTAIRLLTALAEKRGESVRENELSRKAGLLVKKWKKIINKHWT